MSKPAQPDSPDKSAPVRWIARFICWMRFHRLRVVQEFAPNHRKVQCVRCGKYFGMHDGAQSFIEWCAELELACVLMGYGRSLK